MEEKLANFDYLIEMFLDESILNFDYCDGKIAYEWTANREPQLRKTKKTGDYEEYICNFLLSPNHQKSAGRNNILLIIGGSGTGKLTTINYCLKQKKTY